MRSLHTLNTIFILALMVLAVALLTGCNLRHEDYIEMPKLDDSADKIRISTLPQLTCELEIIDPDGIEELIQFFRNIDASEADERVRKVIEESVGMTWVLIFQTEENETETIVLSDRFLRVGEWLGSVSISDPLAFENLLGSVALNQYRKNSSDNLLMGKLTDIRNEPRGRIGTLDTGEEVVITYSYVFNTAGRKGELRTGDQVEIYLQDDESSQEVAEVIFIVGDSE